MLYNDSMEFLRQHQLTIMLFVSGICSVLAVLCFLTRSMPKKRRFALTTMEVYGSLLLIMDRFAYLYRGDPTELGFWMVRIANFCVYFFSLSILHAFNLYIIDLFTHEGGLQKMPRRFRFVEILFACGVLSLIISQFTGFYYTFDEMNCYQREPGIVISYSFPFAMMILLLSIIIQYYRRIARRIRIPLLLFAIIPFIATIIQFFTYGLSLQNIALVGETIVLYIFVLYDMNRTVERVNKLELDFLKEEQKTISILFDQTVTALANAIDAKDEYTHGHSMRVAEYSRRIAKEAGKDEKFCEDVYYGGLLHDVGKIGVPSSIINKGGKLTDAEFAEIRKHPVIGRQILSSISKSPYLSIAANYHHERYDGRGYPEGLKGEDIPEIARIIAVADTYDAMTSKRSYRDPIPQQKVREEIVKGIGTQFDPEFAKIMLHLIDLDTDYTLKEHEAGAVISGKRELHCEEFRSEKSEGIVLTRNITDIRIRCRADRDSEASCALPTIILFDSLDARMHETESKRREMLYYEYASIRCDGHTECIGARKMETTVLAPAQPGKDPAANKNGIDYTIEAVKVRDHVLISVKSCMGTFQVTAALPDCARYAYIALTGEHCTFSNFDVRKREPPVPSDYIPRIAEEVSYITGPEGDIPSIQIDGWRYVSTDGIPVKDGINISFHTQSLPTARLIWHCPFVCLFYSDNKKVDGPNYKELVVIRLDGENWEEDDYANNTIILNKNDTFEGWEAWKAKNKEGMDCRVSIKRESRKITVSTENGGIAIKCVSILKEDMPDVYLSLTGDQCVLTNIRIS